MVLALAAAALIGSPLSQPQLMDARRLTGDPALELHTLQDRELTPGQLRLEQTYRGYRVLNSKLTAEVDAFGRLTRIDRTFKKVSGELPPVNVSVQQAMRTAFADAGVDLDRLPTPTIKTNETLVILAEGSKPQLVYQFPVLSVNPFDSLTALVDATTGKVIRMQNATVTVDNPAKVFDPNPRSAPTLVSKTITTTDSTKLVGDWIDTRQCTHATSDDLEYYVVPFPSTGEFAQYKQLIELALKKPIDWVVVPLCKEQNKGDPDNADDPAAQYQPVLAETSAAAASDTFSEVNFYYHADRVAKYFAAAGAGNLNAGFAGRTPKRLQGSVNFMTPSISTVVCTLGRYNLAPADITNPTAVRAAAKAAFEQRNQEPNVAFGGQTIANCSSLPAGNPGAVDFTAFDNAFFMPALDNSQLGPIAGLLGNIRNFDSMVFGQGRIDFAYDSSVVYHEYTHAVVNSVDALQDGLAKDKFGLDYAPGAMNEGLSDYFASVLNPTLDGCMGPYSAALIPNAECLRDLNNEAKCPDYLVGEVHEDSLAFSAALWAARNTFSAAADQATFDKAVFETLDAMTNDAQFAAFFSKLLTQMTSRGLSTDAASEIFTKKNVLNCERVVALEEGDSSKAISLAGTQTSGGDFAPGFVQYRLQVPKNTKEILLSLEIEDPPQPGGGLIPGVGGGGETPDVRVLLRVGKPVEFDYPTDANTLPTDSEEFELKKNNTALLEISKATEGDWYIAVVNYNGSGHTLSSVSFSVEDTFEDTGTGPKGQSGPTGVTSSTNGGGLIAPTTGNKSGCACGQSADASGFLVLGAFVALALTRRRRRA